MRDAKSQNKCCSRWNELEVINYIRNDLEAAEQISFTDHLGQCADCRERLVSCLSIFMANFASKESDAAHEFLYDPLCRQKNRERFPRQAIVERRSSRLQFGKSLLKAAAMISVLLFSALAYRFMIMPFHRFDLVEKVNNPIELAETYEKLDARIRLNPKDAYAVFERAVCFERLFLFEDAQKDYSRFLGLDNDAANLSRVEERMHSVASRMEHPAPHNPTRYEKLDRHIDAYLAALKVDDGAASEELALAHKIAAEMADKTGEQFGNDIVAFYRTIPYSTAESFIEARKLRSDVEAFKKKEYDAALKNALQAKAAFISLKADYEAERTDVQIIRFLNKLGELTEAQALLGYRLPQSVKNRHLLINAQLLLWKAEVLTNFSDFAKAIDALEESVRLSSPLKVPQFTVNPSMLLASIYYVTNDNERAFSLGYEVLRESIETDSRIPLQLLQILGISAFNLRCPALSERYLQYSIMQSKKENSFSYLAISYAFSGIVRSERRLYAESEDSFANAFKILDLVQDEKIRARNEFAVTGYYARAQLSAGNADKAAALYNRALKLAEKINLEEMLALSQLHQGLGECHMAKGNIEEAKSELSKAIALDRKARERFEQNNALLTFASTQLSGIEQFRRLEMPQ